MVFFDQKENFLVGIAGGPQATIRKTILRMSAKWLELGVFKKLAHRISEVKN
jgi:hypothetical protein